jgi:hypothetical protein
MMSLVMLFSHVTIWSMGLVVRLLELCNWMQCPKLLLFTTMAVFSGRSSQMCWSFNLVLIEWPVCPMHTLFLLYAYNPCTPVLPHHPISAHHICLWLFPHVVMSPCGTNSPFQGPGYYSFVFHWFFLLLGESPGADHLVRRFPPIL